MEEKLCSCRLKPDENAHLDKYWDGSLSNFVHASFKLDVEKVKKNKKKNRIQSVGQNLMFVGFGVIILFQMFNLSFLGIAWFIVFALGMCFFGIGFFGLISEVDIFAKCRKRDR